MASIGITIGANSPEIKQAIQERVEGPILALSKNPQVLAKIANRALQIMTPYVPIQTGALRESAHVVQHARQTKVTWGKQGINNKISGISTLKYARFQYYKNKRGMDRWDKHIQRGTPGFEQLVAYATPLVKKEVKNGSR